MTAITLKIDDDLAARFKEISLKKFHGNDTLALEYALKYLLSEEDREMLRLEQIVEQIQDEIETAGGVTEKEINAYVTAYRHKKQGEREMI
ncbi:MAG: hypothetical protein ACE5OR_15940 [bacterium]